MKHIALSALLLASLAAAAPLRAAGFDITSNSTSAQTISSGTGTIESGKSLTVSGSTVAVTFTGSATVVNDGTINQTGTGRAIRDNTGKDTVTITNNAGASMTTADADVVQMNVATTNVTLNNYGTMTSNNASLGGAQVIDFNAVTTGSNTLNNYATGVMTSYAGDSVRPGANGVVNNYGTIQSFEKSGSTSSDGIDAQTNSGIQVHNFTGGLISGARHGITGGNTTGTGAYAMTITNQTGATIQGNDGSGVNIDGINGNEVVTITNGGTITGNGVTADGDGVDVDGLVNITNTGTIKSLNANADTSEGITVGGGTITNSGTIEGSLAAGNTSGATGVGITIGGIDKVTPTDPMYGTTVIDNQAGGLIRGDTDYGIRVVGGASGFTLTITNEAGATIEGGGSNAVIQTGADNDTINESGLITSDTAATGGTAIDLGAGTNTLNVTGGTASIVGSISGGTGTSTLNVDPGAGNTFTFNYGMRNFASTYVKSGTFLFNGTATNNGSFTVQSGAAFGGHGTLALGATGHLIVQNGGAFLAQGMAIDVTGITAGGTAAEFQAGSTLTFTLSAVTPGLTITGNVANTVVFNGNTFEFTGSVANGTYVLVQGSSTTFSGLTTDADGNVTGGAALDSAFASQHAGSHLVEQGGNLVVVVTPEPGTWALCAVGAGILALAYRRRLQAA